MLILRLLILLMTALLVLSGAMFVLTRNRKYLDFAWQTLRFAVLVVLVFALLFVLERYVLAGWRVML
jgi:ubiquinone biosynthesis protein COQ9